MSSAHAPPVQRRWIVLVVVLFLVGAYLLGRGLLNSVSLIYGGSEEEAAQRDTGLIQLTLGCACLAFVGLVRAFDGRLPIAVVMVVAAVVTPLLAAAWVAWAWVSGLILVALALGRTLSAVWLATTRSGRG